MISQLEEKMNKAISASVGLRPFWRFFRHHRSEEISQQSGSFSRKRCSKAEGIIGSGSGHCLKALGRLGKDHRQPRISVWTHKRQSGFNSLMLYWHYVLSLGGLMHEFARWSRRSFPPLPVMGKLPEGSIILYLVTFLPLTELSNRLIFFHHFNDIKMYSPSRWFPKISLRFV